MQMLLHPDNTLDNTHPMTTINIQLTTRAYQTLQDTIQSNPELQRRQATVQELVEEFINNHPDAMGEMLVEAC